MSTTAQEFARRAAWFPAEALAGASSNTGTAGDSGLVTNAYLWSSLPLGDQEALREMNVRLTEMAIEQCAAGGVAANQVDFGSIICLALAEFAAHDVFPPELLELSAERDVVFPWSLLYGNARTPFNFRLARLPLAIAYPRTVDHVVFWVGWVRDHRLSVSIRSGNNSYEGLSSSNRIIIDLTFLTLGADELGDDAPFRIDADAGLVHTAPGVRLGVLYTALAEQGFMLAGGQCAPVCVGGLVGGGGIGMSTRAAGWACDQLVEVECVLANGDVIVANADNEHADLYRACKGGAAGLCVMTRLTLRLLPAQEILFYNVAWNLLGDDGLKGGAKVLEAWQHLAEPAPDAFSSIIFAVASKKPSDPDCRGDALPPVSTSLLSVSGELQIGDDWQRLVQ
ncbi:MAG: FAD-binding oxidoreductase, partial [Gemmatimonadetes bacterium]|nr:FAD-binding oxidoreductase [Gemmatimonadota bacterium]